MMVDLGSFYRGDDYMLRISVVDVDGVAVPITGWSFQATMKLSTEDSDTSAPVKVDVPAVSGPDAINGITYIHFPSSQTAKLLPTRYFVDIQRVYQGIVTTILAAKIKVQSDVTRRTS